MNEINDSTLLIKHLPQALSNEEKISLLKCFGCEEVRVMPSSGHMKHCAFITFSERRHAAAALHRLHQLEVLGSVLIAQFASRPSGEVSADRTEKKTTSSKPVRESCPCSRKLPNLPLGYPANPNLKYLYPDPDGNTLVNICGALLTVPKFYQQVLHLMNKMNLYPPFSPANFVSPVLLEYMAKFSHLFPRHAAANHNTAPPNPAPALPDPTPTPPCPGESSESEMDSDESIHQNLNILPPERASRKRKRLSNDPQRKLRVLKGQPTVASTKETKPQHGVDVVFEDYEEPLKVSINLSLPSSLQQKDDKNGSESETRKASSGFGKIPPSNPLQATELAPDAPEHLLTNNFITEKELQSGRLTVKEMRSHPLFAKHEPGPPSCRLYVKNLPKKATEQDLQHIFGLFIDINCQNELQMFDVRVMTRGRMKGQAFVGLPTVAAASRAIRLTNGYVLMGKPLIVSFARSAKPRVDAGL